MIDFVVNGFTSDPNSSCVVTDLWNNKLVGSFTSYYYANGLQPHESLSLKFVCTSQKH
jgi:hypothetical protein